MPLHPNWRARLVPPSAPEDQRTRRAGVAIVVSLQASAAPSVLLMKRAEHPLDPWSGHVSLPGGRVEPTDADSLDAARRETLEELGVDLERDGELIGALEPLRATARGRTVDLAVHPWIFAVERPLELVPNAEAEEGFWMSLADVAAGTLDHTHSFVIGEGQRVSRPAWLAPGAERSHVVWGLTYHILARFLEQVRSDGSEPLQP
jgi:8-oxo-dGTP pyrophosphatase MutT (NUDIX family)